MTFAIQAENLGKSYLIGHRRREPYQTLRESLVQGVKGAWTRLRHPNLSAGGSDIEEFWALRDVSFEIQPGDRVGIIGRNGAGKSTLLKILSRITEPTTGRFVTRGRVAALLEVGTGFHPELSGRENIYLNGAILGMSRSDVKRQFDAIVDFAGVEKFLDTPVKRYSSGMYVRLAFAVAAHLEPDILIVDEVLAVGDAEFQKKCLGKMEEVGKEGRTVVFVSHNMGAIRRLCDKGMVVDGGRVTIQEDIMNCLILYSNNAQAQVHFYPQRNAFDDPQIKPFRLNYVSIFSNHSSHDECIRTNSPLIISCCIESNSTLFDDLKIDIRIDDYLGERVFWLSSANKLERVPRKKGHVDFIFKNCPLNSGTYILTICLSMNGFISDWLHDVARFIVHDGNFFETGTNPPPEKSPLLVDFSISSRAI